MGYAQHADTEDSALEPLETAARTEVPNDWFVDPAAQGSRQSTLDEAATAFLAAHEAGLLTDSAPRLLSEGFADREDLSSPSPRLTPASEPSAPEESADATSLWEAMAPFAEEEAGALAWQAEALCAQTDPEAFFPEKGGSTRDAKRVCGACAVREECLQYALENDERFGIWGGLSERERRRVRREGR